MGWDKCCIKIRLELNLHKRWWISSFVWRNIQGLVTRGKDWVYVLLFPENTVNCLKVPCKVDTLIISEPSLTSHNETFLAYRLWIAVSSIISGPGCKEWLFFLYIFLPPPPAGCRHRQYARTGFQSVQQYQQHLRTFLKQFSRPTSDFVNKKYLGRNGVRGKSDLCFNVPSR